MYLGQKFPAPIEQEKMATADETVSEILEVQLQKEIEFYRERMRRAMYELNYGTNATCLKVLYDALLDDHKPFAPTSTDDAEIIAAYNKLPPDKFFESTFEVFRQGYLAGIKTQS